MDTQNTRPCQQQITVVGAIHELPFHEIALHGWWPFRQGYLPDQCGGDTGKIFGQFVFGQFVNCPYGIAVILAGFSLFIGIGCFKIWPDLWAIRELPLRMSIAPAFFLIFQI